MKGVPENRYNFCVMDCCGGEFRLMIKIATIEEMRVIEAAADKAGVSYAQMMDTAGLAVANCIKPILEEFPEPRVVVLVGPGNNGGAGLVPGRPPAEEKRATVPFF